MASLRGNRKTAIGLFVDGLEVKLARLSLKRGRVVVEELRSATLVSRLEEQRVEAMAEAAAPAEGEFAGGGGALPEVAGGEDNNAVFLGLLSAYPTSKYALAYAIAEPSLYYHAVEGGTDLRGRKLKENIATELQAVRGSSPSIEAIDVFPSSEGGLTAVVREDGLGLYRNLEGLRSFLGKSLPRFSLIESADLAIIGLARANYGFSPEETTVIIYVGVEFSRLIFLKGSEFFHFAPMLGEGHDAANIQNTIYSRLLLEQDSIGIPRVDRILIAGEARRIGFDEFLKGQLPDIDIQYLQTPYLDASELPAETQDQVPEYVIPIATAWKVLQESHPAFYRVNLIPSMVIEGQKVFKLAWHGYLLMALIFLSTFFFTARITDLREQISSKEAELARKESQAKVNDELRADIQKLQQRMEGFRVALTVYNTIVPGYDRWSKVIAKLSKGFRDVGSVWITDMTGREDMTMMLNGFTLYKIRIPRASSIFDNSTLKSVTVIVFREKTEYQYQIDVKLPEAK